MEKTFTQTLGRVLSPLCRRNRLLRVRHGCLAAIILTVCACCNAPNSRSDSVTSDSSYSRPSPQAGGSSTEATGTLVNREGELNPPGSETRSAALSPKAGKYIFLQEGSGPFGDTRYDITVTLEVVQVEESLFRVEIHRDSKYISEGFVERWTPSGIYRETRKSTFKMTDEVQACRFEDSEPIVQFPLRVGDSWEYRGRCDSTSFSSTHKVLRTETLDIAGENVKAFVIRREASQDRYLTSWFSEEYSLPVKLHREVKDGERGVRSTEILRSVIRS